MLVMCIEAVRQAAGSRRHQISGIQVQQAEFLYPIIVGDTIETSPETIVELRPMTKMADEKGSGWSEVRIFSCMDSKWNECFRTKVQTQYSSLQESYWHGPDERQLEDERISAAVDTAIESCSSCIDTPTLYRFLGRHGFGHRSLFQLLRNVRWDGDQTSCAQVDMLSARRLYQEEAESPVHPAVLDAAVQLLVAQASKGLGENLPTIIPKVLANAWFSSKIWNSSSVVRLCTVQHTAENLVSGLEGSIYALADDGSPLCVMDNLHMAEVSAAVPYISEHMGLSNTDPTMLVYRICWKPSLRFLGAEQLQHMLVPMAKLDDADLKTFLPKMEIAMLAAARKAIASITETQLADSPKYMMRYVASMEHQLAQYPEPARLKLTDKDLELILQECEIEKPDWRVFPMVARALPSILCGQTDPVDLLFSSKALEALYEPSFKRHEDVGLLKSFLDLASHENPSLQILEVGAGTGAMSRHVINALRSCERETGQRRFAEYVYTDISAAFFENARSSFGEIRNRMRFQVLDLEANLLDQGYEHGTYDIIVAGSVLHVCASLNDTLQKVRALLKPGGFLVFLEIPKPESICANIGFGLLEGWWAAEEKWRQYSPLTTEGRWDELLRQTGFSGVDVAFRDSEDSDCLLTSIMVSRAIEGIDVAEVRQELRPVSERQVIIVVDRASRVQWTLAERILRRYPQAQILDLSNINETLANPSALLISLVEVGNAFLANLSPTEFDELRAHLVNVQDLLWVTACASTKSDTSAMPTLCDPHLGLATGFLRTIRAEYENKHIVTLAIENCSQDMEDQFIIQIVQSCFNRGVPTSTEVEFVASDDMLKIGRLEYNKDLDEKRESLIHPKTTSQAWGSGRPLALEIGTPGMLDSLRFKEDEESSSADIGSQDIEIEAAVWPVSFRDVFIALGRLGKEPLGYECAGTITRIGAGASHCTDLSVGQRVLMLSPGCMRSHPRASADAVFKIPDHLSFEDAVAGMNPGMTAYHALVNIARLQPGEKVLIHSAAGSTGQMACKIAQGIGAEIFVTVGHKEKKALVTDPCGLNIPASHVFYSRDISFKKGIRRLTHGYGVDVILNSLSGEGLVASFDTLAPYGRFINIGKTDIIANSSLPMAGFAKNISFASIDLYHIVITNNHLTRQLVDKVLAIVSNEKVGPPSPLHVYTVSQVEQAFRYMQGGKNTGRILVSLAKDNVVLVSSLIKKKAVFIA